MEKLTYSTKVIQLINQESGFEPELFNYDTKAYTVCSLPLLLKCELLSADAMSSVSFMSSK